MSATARKLTAKRVLTEAREQFPFLPARNFHFDGDVLRVRYQGEDEARSFDVLECDGRLTFEER